MGLSQPRYPLRPHLLHDPWSSLLEAAASGALALILCEALDLTTDTGCHQKPPAVPPRLGVGDQPEDVSEANAAEEKALAQLQQGHIEAGDPAPGAPGH